MSNPLIKRLFDQRLHAESEIRSIVELADSEKRELTADENTTIDAAAKRSDELNASLGAMLEAEERAAAVDKRMSEFGKPGENPEIPEVNSTAKDLRALATGERRSLDVTPSRTYRADEFRTLSKLSAGAGANTVKISFYDQLMAHLIEVSGLMNAGPTLLQTTTGEQIQVPKTTAHSSGALFAEAASITASDPAFGQAALDAYKYAVFFQVSNELVTDTSVDLEGYLAMQAGRAIGNAFGADCVVGDGSAKPQGIVPVSTVGVTGSTGVVGAFSADNLIDLYFSVIAPYRNSPSCGWLMKDSTLAAVRKLKDTTNQYLWQPSLQIGAPDTLLGKPVYTDPSVAAPALSARSVVFGDFSAYFLRMVQAIRFERSDEFAFQNDLITFRCILRGDGELIDRTGAVKVFVGAGT